MNRQEHLQWCKKRALDILNNNDLTGAFASFVSDMSKHSETKNHSGLELGGMLLVSGNLNTQSKMKNFIEGFN